MALRDKQAGYISSRRAGLRSDLLQQLLPARQAPSKTQRLHNTHHVPGRRAQRGLC